MIAHTRYIEFDMQVPDGINFDPVVDRPELHAWQLILAVVLFAGLIFGAVWWSRRHANRNAGSLKLR